MNKLNCPYCNTEFDIKPDLLKENYIQCINCFKILNILHLKIREQEKNWVVDKKYIGTLAFSNSRMIIRNMDLEKHKLSGKGLGRKYYEDLENYAKQKGIKEIFGQLADDQDSGGFWVKMGFEIIKYNTKKWKSLMKLLEKYFYDDTRKLNLKWDLIYKKI